MQIIKIKILGKIKLKKLEEIVSVLFGKKNDEIISKFVEKIGKNSIKEFFF